MRQALDMAAIQVGSRVEKPDIQSYQGDKINWQLQAQSAQEKAGVLVLDKPVVTLYNHDGEAIPVRSKQGEYIKAAGKVRLRQQVRISYQGWVIESEALDYRQDQGILDIPGAFEMYKEGMDIQGKTMRLDKDKGKLWVTGGVHMRIEETR